jgi:hypothetical protein
MKSIYILTLVVFLFTYQFTFAQTDTIDKDKITLKLGINYNTGLNYFGRTDSLKSTGVFPLAELWLSKNVYLNAAPVFVNNAVQRMEYSGTVTSLGYLHSTDRWVTNLYFLKPFYKENSQLVQSALKAQAGMSFTMLNKVINLSVGGDAKWSDKIDFGATAGIDHLIRKQMTDQWVLVIDPSFYTYAGTQNFTTTYYKKNAGFLVLPGSSEQVSENTTKFNVLAYEFSVPVVYAKGNWMALLTPSYILPQNLVTVAGRPDLSERGQNTFYATIGLKYTLQ